MKKRVKKRGDKGFFNKKMLFTLGVIILLLFLLWFSFLRTQKTGIDDNTALQRPEDGRDTDLGGTRDPGEGPKQYIPSNMTPPIAFPLPGGSGGNVPSAQSTPEKVNGMDSDGGENFFVQGTCYDYINNYSVSDVCLVDGDLREFEFTKYGEFEACWYSDITCSSLGDYFCSNGQCLETGAFVAYDSDGTMEGVDIEGVNPFVKGSCTDYSGVSVDNCSTEYIINEWYVYNNTCLWMPLVCPAGCSNGVCSELPESSASDTDGGKNIYDAGVCSDTDGEHEDYCSSGLGLIEWYIEGSECVSESIVCELGCDLNVCKEEELDCSEVCTSSGYNEEKEGFSNRISCENSEDSSYANNTAWLEDACCCYFVPYDEDEPISSPNQEFLQKASCYYDADGSYYEDSCEDRDTLIEKSLLIDIEEYVHTCYFNSISCSSVFGEDYVCENGACMDIMNTNPTSCSEYCIIEAEYTEGTCGVNRAGGENCEAFGVHMSGGDQFCSTGDCCCTR